MMDPLEMCLKVCRIAREENGYTLAFFLNTSFDHEMGQELVLSDES